MKKLTSEDYKKALELIKKNKSRIIFVDGKAKIVENGEIVGEQG